MKRKVPKGWIKISEFEKLTTISNKTITSAIKRGAIPVSYVARIGATATAPYYLDPKKSALEWYNSINANHPISRPLMEMLAAYIRTFDPTAIGESVTNNQAPKETQTPAIENNEHMTMAEAQRTERVAKARIAELELKEKEGTLVQKSLIDSELFTAAQEIRNALLAIPDRIVDQVIAQASNRNKTHRTIYDAIAAELEKLADINNRISR